MWAHVIGDTVRLVDKEKSEIIITGRTKHFLSLVGEHLSVDNMNKAIEMVSAELNISIPEFTVAGEPHGLFFAHHWYLATDDHVNDQELRIFVLMNGKAKIDPKDKIATTTNVYLLKNRHAEINTEESQFSPSLEQILFIEQYLKNQLCNTKKSVMQC